MPEKNEAQLRQRLEQASTLSEYRRIQCVYLREKYGYSSNQIAEITTYHPASVRRIQSKYRKNGIAALSPKPKGGRNHQNLSLADEQAFIADLVTKAASGQIIEVSQIHRAYQEKVGKSTVYALLHRHQWRKVVPRPQHPKHDELAADTFKKIPHAYPTSSKGSKAKRVAFTSNAPGRGAVWSNQRAEKVLGPKRDSPRGFETNR